MEILVKNQAVIKVIDEIGEAYRSLCPADYEAFLRHVDLESKFLIKPSGMSADGTFMNCMKIPCITTSDGRNGNLYSFIKDQMRKRCGIEDFFSNRKNYFLLCQIWHDAWVRKQPTVRLDLGALHDTSVA